MESKMLVKHMKNSKIKCDFTKCGEQATISIIPPGGIEIDFCDKHANWLIELMLMALDGIETNSYTEGE